MEWFFQLFTMSGAGFFALIFALIIGNLIYRMMRHGSIKGGLYGARIDREVGSVKGETVGLVSKQLKVHQLSRQGQEAAVGLEVVAKSFASFKTLPVVLSRTDARRLAKMLQRAAGD